MEFTTRFELHSQTTRLFEGRTQGSAIHPTGLSPSLALPSRRLGLRRCRTFLYKLQFGLVADFKFELLPLHSPLLRQSLLVSFPPLIDMLKFSGYPYLIRGQT